MRIGLAEKLGLGAPDAGRAARPPERDKPRTPVEASLAEIWADVLGTQDFGVHDDFFLVGGDSLRAVQMFERIRRAFGVNVPMTTLVDGPTIERFAATIERAPDLTPWPTLVPLQPRGTHPPLFFVHGLGGYVSCFASLAHALGPDQPFYGLQAPGLDGLQAPLTRVEDMATRYIAEIRTVQPNGPLFLGGFSSGGMIAFEMARQLAATGQTVASLSVLDPAPAPADHTWFRWRPASVVGLAGAWGRRINNFARADRQRRVSMIHRGLDRLGIVPWATSTRRHSRAKGEALDVSELPHHHQAVVGAIVRAVGAYAPCAYAGRVTLFRARTQRRLCVDDPTIGWSALASGGVVVHTVPGDHEGILYEPNVQTLAARLGADLAEARRRSLTEVLGN
jgi:thioesterase domain-containing protein/aryl carrier-like protein